MGKLAVIYHSNYGHTKLQAEAVHRGASGVEGIEAELMTAEEAAGRLDELDGFDAMIFGTATYMGNISAGIKEFMEASSNKWFMQTWKDKIAGGFSNSGSFSGDKLHSLQSLVIFAMQHSMIWVSNGLVRSANDPEAMNSINGPGPDAHNRVGSYIGPVAASFQVKPPEAPAKGDIETAELYGRRVAEITTQFVKGRG